MPCSAAAAAAAAGDGIYIHYCITLQRTALHRTALQITALDCEPRNG